MTLVRTMLLVPLLLAGLTTCFSEPPGERDKAQAVSEYLAEFLQATPGDAARHTERLNQLLKDNRALDRLVAWSLQYPQGFALLLPTIDNEEFTRRFSRRVVAQGKSFVFLERFAQNRAPAMSAMRDRVRQLEGRDRRTMVVGKELSHSALQRIARLNGKAAGVSWSGAAVLVTQSECRLGFITAGHNVVDRHGQLRTPLDNFRLSLADRPHKVLQVLPIQASAAPEQDWALLVAEKVRCGDHYPEAELAIAPNRRLPARGMAVGLYCFHQGERDVMPSLYQESCRIYPTDAGVLDYYANRPAGQLGVHTCLSEKGSSGCPILFQENRMTYLLGMQIERDADTGAGIARLISGEFAQALVGLQRDFGGEEALTANAGARAKDDD